MKTRVMTDSDALECAKKLKEYINNHCNTMAGCDNRCKFSKYSEAVCVQEIGQIVIRLEAANDN